MISDFCSSMYEVREVAYAVQQSWQESRHLDMADDLFEWPQGSPRTDKMSAAAIHWAELILRKIDSVFRTL